jgi:hypothetical protein
MSTRPTLTEFEAFHAAKIVRKDIPVTPRELLSTVALTVGMSPFSFVIFMVIPLMGPITVMCSAFISALYLFYRRSWTIAAVVLSSLVLFWGVLFMTIQVIKNNLEVPLFFLTALGIPISAIFCMFVASKIWIIRGGAE